MIIIQEYDGLVMNLKDIYDEKDDTLVFSVSGTSIKKLKDSSKETHALDKVDLVIQFTKKGHSILSIKKQEE